MSNVNAVQTVAPTAPPMTEQERDLLALADAVGVNVTPEERK